MASSLRDLATNIVKLEKFDGGNFRRWQKKMHFLLATLQVAYVLTSDPPQEHDDEIVEQIRRRHKWDNDDYICRGHILNSMCDWLFDTYQTVAYAKELWNLLETRYMKEDATSKKFLVSQFNNYQMREDRSIME